METAQFANQVIEECVSTNDLARILGEAGYPHGTWVSSRRQSDGRGRLGRHWESLEGNLFLSLVLRDIPRVQWTWVPLAVAVGCVRFLSQRFDSLNFRIKWPNDIWIGSAKCGGVLCEAVGAGLAEGFIIAGIGLNCAQSPVASSRPGGHSLLYPVTSLSESLGQIKAVTADEVREGLSHSVLAALTELRGQGTAGIAAFYDQRALFASGRQIRWGEVACEGVVIGLGPNGDLLVRQGLTIRSLLSEDVSLKDVPKASGGSQL